MAYLGLQPTSAAYITDTFSGTGAQTSFAMSVAPASTTSMLVSITGVLQDPATYAIVGMNLNFSAAPPAGTGNISVRYLGVPASSVASTAYRTVTEFTATAGQATFNVPSYTVGFINVYLNGVRLGGVDFTASTGTTVVLVEASVAGDLVVTESFYVSSVLNAIPATAGSVQTTNILDSNVTYAKLQNVSSGKVLGRNTSGAGVVQELPIAVDSSGNVGIGAVPSAANRLEVSSAGTTRLAVVNTANSVIGRLQTEASDFLIQTDTNHPINFATNNGAAQMSLATNGDFKCNSGYGSAATAYGCRAWVNFNGTGTVAIRASGNVSSITDNGAGDYTINFATAMPDVNYTMSFTGNGPSLVDYNNIFGAPWQSAPTTSSIRMYVKLSDGAVWRDINYIHAQAFR